MGAGGLLLMGILHESQSIHRAGMKSPRQLILAHLACRKHGRARRGRSRPRVLPQSYQLAA
jgi:hypothetical protein